MSEPVLVDDETLRLAAQAHGAGSIYARVLREVERMREDGMDAVAMANEAGSFSIMSRQFAMLRLKHRRNQ